ncbi:hypothetical protein [Streptomyces morookaense]|uniref:Uncharacterized protein n=1 Tax=Streptomyces morookaense TaxID=1970 RepID=A0A7Y7BA61_STRMO|nr:hypothetical protein [Streptomyces morookaense]NVK81838.1 hypothetical protein [Streptomyces morookaense]GHF19112.1 hypothetical protein GCM10010359_21010 [Streptomyces morookaense]
MTYNFFTVDPLDESTLYQALASCLEVDVDSVDVADADGDQDSRNWDALVLCDHSEVHGKVSRYLDIYVQDSVAHQPSEADLALRFATATQSVILYPAEENIPSAYWLVTPSGLVTRTRLMAADDDRSVYTIDAVESAVPQLPDVDVEQLPEIVRAHSLPTPIADAFSEAVAARRGRVGEPPSPSLADEPGAAFYRARISLEEWERMVHRMSSGWQPTGRYPGELYREALEARDRVSDVINELPQPVGAQLLTGVNQLDDEFQRFTQDDNGQTMGQSFGLSGDDVAGRAWWWKRKPVNLPW